MLNTVFVNVKKNCRYGSTPRSYESTLKLSKIAVLLAGFSDPSATATGAFLWNIFVDQLLKFNCP